MFYSPHCLLLYPNSEAKPITAQALQQPLRHLQLIGKPLDQAGCFETGDDFLERIGNIHQSEAVADQQLLTTLATLTNSPWKTAWLNQHLVA